MYELSLYDSINNNWGIIFAHIFCLEQSKFFGKSDWLLIALFTFKLISDLTLLRDRLIL